jgi:hypothetical protein
VVARPISTLAGPVLVCASVVPNKRRPDADLKVFGIPYRRGKVQRWYTLRPDFPILGLREAEKQSIQILARVSLGEDPAADRARARATPARQLHTMAGVVAAFCEAYRDRRNEKTGRLLSDKQVANTARYLKRAAEHWGNRDIRSIEASEIIDFLAKIGVEHLTTANRVHAAMRTMYGWAAVRGMVDKDALSGVKRVGKERKRERVLDAKEIRLVWHAALALGYPYSHCTRMLLALGQRLGETSRMRRRHIQDDLWTIPREETKADRTHPVPLSSLGQEILADCPQIAEGFVFAGRRSPRSAV